MYAPLNFAGATPFNDWFLPDTTQRHPLGYQVEAVDPYWGYGVFQYIKSNDAIIKGSLVIVGTFPTFLGTLLPSTASLGAPFGVAMAPMASGTYGWIQIVGCAVYKTSATVAADAAVGIGTAGMVGAVYSIPASLFRAYGGHLSDKYGARRIMYWTFIVSVICTFLLSYPPTDYTVQGVGGTRNCDWWFTYILIEEITSSTCSTCYFNINLEAF